jgi:hypothetical protein
MKLSRNEGALWTSCYLCVEEVNGVQYSIIGAV